MAKVYEKLAPLTACWLDEMFSWLRIFERAEEWGFPISAKMPRGFRNLTFAVGHPVVYVDAEGALCACNLDETLDLDLVQIGTIEFMRRLKEGREVSNG